VAELVLQPRLQLILDQLMSRLLEVERRLDGQVDVASECHHVLLGHVDDLRRAGGGSGVGDAADSLVTLILFVFLLVTATSITLLVGVVLRVTDDLLPDLLVLGLGLLEVGVVLEDICNSSVVYI